MQQLTAKVTKVDNIGSPSVLLVTAECRQDIMGTPRTFTMTVPFAEALFPAGQWPPKPGDEFPVTFDPSNTTRPD